MEIDFELCSEADPEKITSLKGRIAETKIDGRRMAVIKEGNIVTMWGRDPVRPGNQLYGCRSGQIRKQARGLRTMNLKQINDRNIRSVKDYWKRQQAIDKQIKDLNEKKDRMRYQHFEDAFTPIMDEVAFKLGLKHYEFLGPFGLFSEYGVHFYNNDIPAEEKDYDKKINCSISFVHYGDGWAIRNYRADTNEYTKGTLGEINGMNHPKIEFTDEMDADWIIKVMRHNQTGEKSEPVATTKLP